VVVGGTGSSSSTVVVAVSQFLTDAFSQLICSIVVRSNYYEGSLLYSPAPLICQSAVI